MNYSRWSGVSTRIACADPVVLLSPPVWAVSCADMVFLLVPLGYSVSSEIAGNCGSGVVGLACLVSPSVSARAFPNSDTVYSLSVRSRSCS